MEQYCYPLQSWVRLFVTKSPIYLQTYLPFYCHRFLSLYTYKQLRSNKDFLCFFILTVNVQILWFIFKYHGTVPHLLLSERVSRNVLLAFIANYVISNIVKVSNAKNDTKIGKFYPEGYNVRFFKKGENTFLSVAIVYRSLTRKRMEPLLQNIELQSKGIRESSG